jgi:hypothetical protein
MIFQRIAREMELIMQGSQSIRENRENIFAEANHSAGRPGVDCLFDGFIAII